MNLFRKNKPIPANVDVQRLAAITYYVVGTVAYVLMIMGQLRH